MHFWERVSAFLEWLLRKKNKGPGSEREEGSFLAVLDRGHQEQITKLSNSNIALNVIQRGHNVVAYSCEPVNK